VVVAVSLEFSALALAESENLAVILLVERLVLEGGMKRGEVIVKNGDAWSVVAKICCCCCWWWWWWCCERKAERPASVSDPWVTENIGMVDGWRTWEQGEWHLVWIGLSTKTIITLHFSSFSLDIFFFFFFLWSSLVSFNWIFKVSNLCPQIFFLFSLSYDQIYLW